LGSPGAGGAGGLGGLEPAALLGPGARGRGDRPLRCRQARAGATTGIGAATAFALAIKLRRRRLRGVVAPVVVIHFSLARNVEITRAPVVGQDVVCLDSPLFDQDRGVGINLAV